MNKIQENTTLKFGNVSTYLAKKSTITALLPGYTPVYTRFKGLLDDIYVTRDKLAIDIKTLTAKKKKARTELRGKLAGIASKTEVYASINNLPELVQAVHYNKSAIDKMSDADLLGAAFTVYDKANSVIASLATYFVLPATLIEFKALIDNYRVLINTTAVGEAERITLTAKLVSLIAAADAELVTLDKLVSLIESSQSNFFDEYHNAHRVRSTPSSSFVLMASVIDALTEDPIQGVKAVFVLQPEKGKTLTKAVEPIVKKSAAKGNFKIKNMPVGIYLVTITKAGYADQVITVEITDEGKVKLNIELEQLVVSTTL